MTSMALAMYAVRVCQWRRRPSKSHRKRAQRFLLTFYGDFSVAGGRRCESAETSQNPLFLPNFKSLNFFTLHFFGRVVLFCLRCFWSGFGIGFRGTSAAAAAATPRPHFLQSRSQERGDNFERRLRDECYS